jgi:hypothetical protein
LERRETTDFWARLLFCLNILASILLIFILLVFHRAQPEFETLFDRFYQLHLRTDWDIRYLHYLIYMVSFGIFISLFGLLLGVFRGRRKNDHKKGLIITGFISLIMLWISMAVV